MASRKFDANAASNFGTLCVEGEYSIAYGHEEAHLAWDGGSIYIGDHYGNPTSAVMDVVQGWCVTGGAGLVIAHFEYGFLKAGDPIADFPFRTLELWNPNNPPPDGRLCWFVEGLWFRLSERTADGTLARVLVHALVEPGTLNAGLYEVDLISLQCQRI